jgi:hypothetical protein
MTQVIVFEIILIGASVLTFGVCELRTVRRKRQD